MTIFTRQHHQALAEVFAAFQIDYNEGPTEVELVARALAVRLRKDNPNFNRARFLKACGMEE